MSMAVYALVYAAIVRSMRSMVPVYLLMIVISNNVEALPYTYKVILLEYIIVLMAVLVSR